MASSPPHTRDVNTDVNVNMTRHELSPGWSTGSDTDTLPSSLSQFYADSVSVCFSRDADKLCVPVGLSCVSALLLLLSCLLRRFAGESPGESLPLFSYSLLGNMCATVGAVLSRQLHIQIMMGAFAAAVDAVHFISLCFPLLLCWNSKGERRRRMLRRRRRQHLLTVCVLMVVVGGFLKSRVSHGPAGRPFSGRRLMHFTIQDNTEILGYALGLLSLIIACTSRFPALRRAYRGQMLTWPHITSGLLCSMAGLLYSAAILLYDTQLGFLMRVMPWLLAAMCSATLDVVIPAVHWCQRGARRQLISYIPDAESLLGDSGVKRHGKQQVHSSAPITIKHAQVMTEMGRYMDVSVQPARKKCLKDVVLSKEEKQGRRTALSIFCRSGSSCDSSVSSDLEWDFEEPPTQWNEPAAKQQEEGRRFPLQDWPTNPEPFNIRTCGLTAEPQKTPSGN